jgi:hypothetical protein
MARDSMGKAKKKKKEKKKKAREKSKGTKKVYPVLSGAQSNFGFSPSSPANNNFWRIRIRQLSDQNEQIKFAREAR